MTDLLRLRVERALVPFSAVIAAVSGLVVLGPGPAYGVGTASWVDNTDPACSDTSAVAGTQGTPFCTIAPAAKRATQPGDTVHVVAGSYREQVDVNGSGTTSDPITFVADSSSVRLLGTSDISTGPWTQTGTTTSWTTPYPAPGPSQVVLDGRVLVRTTPTVAGSWSYDGTAKLLSVDFGASGPGGEERPGAAELRRQRQRQEQRRRGWLHGQRAVPGRLPRRGDTERHVLRRHRHGLPQLRRVRREQCRCSAQPPHGRRQRVRRDPPPQGRQCAADQLRGT